MKRDIRKTDIAAFLNHVDDLADLSQEIEILVTEISHALRASCCKERESETYSTRISVTEETYCKWKNYHNSLEQAISFIP